MKNMREDKTNTIRLNGYTGYSREEFISIIDELFYNAGHLTGSKLIFESTLDPYEDYPGPVEVYVEGLRHVTEAEIKADEEEKELRRLAREMGVSVYKARIFQDLKQRGKI